MNLRDRFRQLWDRTRYVPRNEIYVTRLRANAPVVTPQEVAKLERKWKQTPVDWDALPNG